MSPIQTEPGAEEQNDMASNPNRDPQPPKLTPYKVPPRWEKGEPLMVERLCETCYRLYRSGSYLALPGSPVTHEVEFLEFGSRLEMVEFQRWWDTASHSYRGDFRAPHFFLTKREFVEILQEIFHLNLKEILGERQGADKVPAFSMSVTVTDEATAARLNALHWQFVSDVKDILEVRD